MPPFRMTTRRWMAAVAVVGLLMGGSVVGYRLKRRYDYFLAYFRKHAQMEEYLRHAEAFKGDAAEPAYGATTDFERMNTLLMQRRHNQALWSRMVDYHVLMARKYRHATCYPWLPVEPDPPKPEWQWFFRPFP